MPRAGVVCADHRPETRHEDRSGLEPTASHAALGVLGSRSAGNRVFYFMVDPCVLDLLDKGACLAIDAQRRATGGRSR